MIEQKYEDKEYNDYLDGQKEDYYELYSYRHLLTTGSPEHKLNIDKFMVHLNQQKVQDQPYECDEQPKTLKRNLSEVLPQLQHQSQKSRDNQSLLSKLRQRINNYNSKNQIISEDDQSSFLKSEHLNNKQEHSYSKLNYQRSQLGQLGLGSLQKTIEHEKKIILENSKKLEKIDKFYKEGIESSQYPSSMNSQSRNRDKIQSQSQIDQQIFKSREQIENVIKNRLRIRQESSESDEWTRQNYLLPVKLYHQPRNDMDKHYNNLQLQTPSRIYSNQTYQNSISPQQFQFLKNTISEQQNSKVQNTKNLLRHNNSQMQLLNQINLNNETKNNEQTDLKKEKSYGSIMRKLQLKKNEYLQKEQIFKKLRRERSQQQFLQDLKDINKHEMKILMPSYLHQRKKFNQFSQQKKY